MYVKCNEGKSMLFVCECNFAVFTCRQMLEMTCQVANTFKQYGIMKGDRVAIYMPMSPLLAAAMLACARIGAIHSVVFAGFSAEALKSRILDGMYLISELGYLIVIMYFNQLLVKQW